MGKFLDRLKCIFRDRRQVAAKVVVDRREPKVSLKDADQKMREAMDKLERTARLRREDFYDRIK